MTSAQILGNTFLISDAKGKPIPDGGIINAGLVMFEGTTEPGHKVEVSDDKGLRLSVTEPYSKDWGPIGLHFAVGDYKIKIKFYHGDVTHTWSFTVK